MKAIVYLLRKSKIIIVVLLLSTTVFPAFSQTDSTKSFLDHIAIGANIGLNFASMNYSNAYLAEHESALFPRTALGFFAEIDLSKHISFRPEVSFIGKGQKIDDEDYYYKFASSYIDWRLPILLNIGKKNSVQPYFMVAPAICFASGGTVENESFDTDITDASINPIDIELRAGLGIKIPLKLDKLLLIGGAEVSYGLGLIDNYSEKEIDGKANALNKAFYSIEGTRTNRGVQANISLAIPFSNFKGGKKEKKEQTKSLFAQEKAKETIDAPKEVVKECYTIEEINALIDDNRSVDNKVICMNNLNFEFNKSTLAKDSKDYLNNVVSLLVKVPAMKMKISGHTDNTGTDEYNMELSKKRAAAVFDYLISRGISKDRLSYDYFGAKRPLVPNDTEANKAKNRRVEFAITSR